MSALDPFPLVEFLGLLGWMVAVWFGYLYGNYSGRYFESKRRLGDVKSELSRERDGGDRDA